MLIFVTVSTISRADTMVRRITARIQVPILIVFARIGGPGFCGIGGFSGFYGCQGF